MPKVALAVASSCYLILSAKVCIGNGSDAPDYDGFLFEAWKRASIKVVVDDAGYDSADKHASLAAKWACGRSFPPGHRPGRAKRPRADEDDALPNGWHAKRIRVYGQRAQSETAHSMMKRNKGESLHCRAPERRQKEMLLKVLTHNIMLLCDGADE